MNKILELKLKKLANKSRILTMKMFHESRQGGHLGGSFSSAEILTVLYNGILKIDPKNTGWKLRDHFVLSKGHISGMFASILFLKGFFGEDFLTTYDEMNSAFGMHTTINIPGCEFAAGSLGHGLSFAVGIALGKKIEKIKSRVFVLMGDGELNEGSVWEAAMSANKWKLDNLIAIVDRNMCNMEGLTENVMPLEPLEDKWRSFGWSVKTVNGHSISDLYEILHSIPFKVNNPSLVIANTVKGKGLSSFEGDYKSHYVRIDEHKYNENIEELKKYESFT